MKCKCKMAVAFLVVLALLVPLSFGCGGGDGKGVTITLGEITDLTGPASQALIPVHYALVDLVRYYNEEGLIPGVKLKLVTYDNAYNPSRDLPGYYWCKGKGAEVIVGTLFLTAETLKPFAERDKTLVITTGTTQDITDPPGWVFAIACRFGDQVNTVLKWISENRWDYVAEGRVPKVGVVGWDQPATIDLEKGVRAYCQANSDKFEWIGANKTPVGTTNFSGEVNKSKEADILVPFGHPAAFIIRAFHDKGYYPTFIADSTAAAYKGFYVNLVGWENLDGFLTTDGQLQWWDVSNERIDLARELLQQWRPGQAEDMILAGSGYGGGFITQSILMEMIRQAVEQAGAENFSGQALYNTAVNFEVQFGGHPKWYFTETDRAAIHDVLIHEWSADEQTLVRVTPDWLPLVTE